MWNVTTYILVKQQRHTNYTVVAKGLQLNSSVYLKFHTLLMQQFSGTADITFTNIVKSKYRYVEFLIVFTKFWKATTSFVLSAWNNSAPTGEIFIKTHIWAFFGNQSRKFKFL
jgi:hypothetical protein